MYWLSYSTLPKSIEKDSTLKKEFFTFYKINVFNTFDINMTSKNEPDECFL